MQNVEVVALVFNQQGFLFGFFGGLGGAVRSAILRSRWIETVRGIFISSATAFSCGVLSPAILGPFIGGMSSGIGQSLGTLCAGAFLMGLVAVTYVERLIDRKNRQDDDPNE